MTLTKKASTYSTFDVIHKKKIKIIFLVQTWRVTESFGGLNCSPAQLAGELRSCEDTWEAWISLKTTGSEDVNTFGTKVFFHKSIFIAQGLC